MIKLCTVILGCIFTIAVSASEMQDMKRLRINQINRYHLGVSGDILLGRNTAITGGMQFRVGHNGQFANLVVVADHSWNNRFNPSFGVDIKSNAFSVGIGLRENLIRKNSLTFYVMESASYNYPYNISYIRDGEDIVDNQLMRPYLSASGRIGIIWKQIDLNLHLKASLQPEYAQKYIYENRAYDYYALRDMIDSRITVGISVVYHIDL